MTYEEAMDNIRCALDGGCHQACNTKYRGDCTDAEVIASVETLQELVGNTDKYKWHDLRKNPDDLPVTDKSVFFLVTNRYGNRMVLRGVYMHEGEYECDCGWEDCGIYDADNDCWLAKEGWYEESLISNDYNYFEVCKLYNVIAWREIEPFEEVE